MEHLRPSAEQKHEEHRESHEEQRDEDDGKAVPPGRFVGILFDREHPALHDVSSATTVVHDWEALTSGRG
jgi:hypothetical protein